MLYGGLDIYLRHTLIILSGNRLILKSVLKLEKVPFSPQQHICSQKQETERRWIDDRDIGTKHNIIPG